MCIFIWFLFTLVEWLSLFKEDKCFNYWITNSATPPALSYLGGLLFLIESCVEFSIWGWSYVDILERVVEIGIEVSMVVEGIGYPNSWAHSL